MKRLTAKKLRDLYFDFFVKKGHRIIPSAPLIPEGDSSTLFISAGMHPLVPYFLGEPHPSGKRLVNVQECLRTVDIEATGNEFHHTWFEMLGNWSLGDYFKKESINWSLEFLTQVLGIDKDRLSVTCFAGDKDAPKDEVSARVWRRLGIPSGRVHFLPKKDNWWGPVGKTGPCGPDTEMFVDLGGKPCCSSCRPGCSCGKYCEIWNNVFIEFNKNASGKYLPLKQRNVDTGMGVERTLAVINGAADNYQTSVWQSVVRTIEKISGKGYEKEENRRPIRIIADHLRAAVFAIADGVRPGNKEQSYVLRRLVRRSIRQGKLLGIEQDFVARVAEAVLANQDNFAGDYPELNENKKEILSCLAEEEEKFRRTLNRGLKEFVRIASRSVKSGVFSGDKAFYLYETFGFPYELIEEEAREKGLKMDKNGFSKRQKEHREKSRQSAEKRFKGGLGDTSARSIAHHTATHLLHQALRQVLGDRVSQVGSAITEEKLRFDFTHPKALTEEEIGKVEKIINKIIGENLLVEMTVVSYKESRKQGALSFFKNRYPEKVKVYSIGNFSKEVCGGPHVKSTGELGKFSILKQESCGSGKRRIYARVN